MISQKTLKTIFEIVAMVASAIAGFLSHDSISSLF